MANFQGHITTSGLLGVAVGAAGKYYLDYDWGVTGLAAGLTALGGMLPDLDSDSGIPVRELFGLAGVIVPLMLVPRLESQHLQPEKVLVIMALAYLFVRYGLSELFRKVSVHRGMFHSVPAMLIAGLAVFLMHHDSAHALSTSQTRERLYLAGGTMVGFLSHLVLDELFAVNLMGVVPRFNQFAGSAVKLWSKSWLATSTTYALLGLLAYLAWVSIGSPTGS